MVPALRPPASVLLALMTLAIAATGCSALRSDKSVPVWADVLECQAVGADACFSRADAAVRDHMAREPVGSVLTSVTVRTSDVEVCSRRRTRSSCTTYSTDEVLELAR